VARFHERALDEIARIPGVTGVGLANVLPLDGTFPNGAMEVEGKTHDPRGPFTGFSIYRIASGGFFGAMQIPLLRGRTFEPQDGAGAPRVVVVNESYANQEWPGEDPIGKRVRPAGMDANSVSDAAEPWSTVIGVVGDVRHAGVTSAFRPAYYFDYRQRPAYRSRSATYTIRATGPVADPVRDILRRIDTDVPFEVRAMEDRVSAGVSDRSFTTILLGAFAGIALTLATVGVHGVVSYAVARRTREIGVRLALGAEPRQVRQLVQVNAMRVVAIGLVTGAAAAFGLAYVVRALLFDVSPADPRSFVMALAALAGAAWLASLFPARRATRVDPMIAIRAE
jgi:predicted permease